MALDKTVKVDKSGGVEIPEDTHIGLLVGVVHLGLQKNTYKGVTSVVDQVLLQFELQDVLMPATGKPVVVSKIVRSSLKEKANLIAIVKALGADVEEGVVFEELIGRAVMVDMQKNANGKMVAKGFTKVSSINKSHVKPFQSTPKLFLDVDEITDGQKEELPEWIRKLINERERTAQSNGPVDDSIEL